MTENDNQTPAGRPNEGPITLDKLKMFSVILFENDHAPGGINSYGMDDEQVIATLELALDRLKKKEIIINKIA